MEGQRCCYCFTVPDNILTLQCGHQICLACSAQDSLCKTPQSRSIVCRICARTTRLPAETIAQLEHFAKAERSDPKKRRPCFDHVDELVMYFCCDCQCKCVCAECVIHGRHRSHSVEPIKRAKVMVEQKIKLALQRLQSLQLQTSSISQSIQAQLKLAQSMEIHAHKEVSLLIEELVQALRAKEVKLHSDLSAVFDEYTTCKKRQIEVSNSRANELLVVGRELRELLRREEVDKIDGWVERSQLVSSLSSEELPKYSQGFPEKEVSAILQSVGSLRFRLI